MAMDENEKLKILEQLYHTYKDALFRYLCKLTREHNTAEDLLHDSFILMANSFDKLRDINKFKSWAYTICFNSFRSWYKQRSKVHFTEKELDTIPDARIFSSLDNNQNRLTDFISLFIDELDPLDRSIFILSHWQNLTYPEIASANNISLRSVNRRMQITMEKLSTQVEKARIVVGNHLDIGGTP